MIDYSIRCNECRTRELVAKIRSCVDELRNSGVRPRNGFQIPAEEVTRLVEEIGSEDADLVLKGAGFSWLQGDALSNEAYRRHFTCQKAVIDLPEVF